MRGTLCLIFLVPFVSCASEIKDGPFDGVPFKPRVPVVWSFTNKLPERLTTYRIADVKLAQSAISNAAAIGGFTPLNLIKSKDNSLIEFSDKRGEHDFTKFLKMSARQGWVKYYDGLASKTPAHAVPSLEEAERLALRCFVQLGGGTNETPPFPWPHNESTITTYDKPGGREIGKYINSRSIRASRQIDGIPIMGNDFTITFGNDAKPSMIDMNWTPLKPMQSFRVATTEELLTLIKDGKSFVQVFPLPSEDITIANSYTVKNVLPLYAELSNQGGRWMKPYGSLLVEANMNGRLVEFVINCPIVADPTGSFHDPASVPK
jgi:hypothetical protein